MSMSDEGVSIEQVLHAYLDGKIGCLDVRRTTVSDVAVKRIERSLIVRDGVAGLQDRFSWLPPRTPTAKQMLVVYDEVEGDKVRYALRSWSVISFVEGGNATLWSEAQRLGLVALGDDRTPLKPPDLLFEPSELVRQVFAYREGCVSRGQSTTLLDLGCGAGRDLAWIVRAETDHPWRVSGMDHILSIIRRARMLAHEFQLDGRQGSGIEAFVQAQSNADGTLQALPFTTSASATSSLQDFARSQLPHSQFDVLLMVRFFHLALLKRLPELTRVGSLIAVAHFTTVSADDEVLDRSTIMFDYQAPMQDKRFEKEHVEYLLHVWTYRGTSWRIVRHHVMPCEDGRPLRNIIWERTS
jgi:SAM-dependent methyltransferase